MSIRPKGRHAVYVGTIPTDFWPQSTVDVPNRLENVDLLKSALMLSQASALVRDHNGIQLARAIPGGRWAFVLFRLKGGVP